MERSHEQRLRDLEDQQLIADTEKNYRVQTDEQNRRRRTKLIAWIAIVISIASITINAIDKFA